MANILVSGLINVETTLRVDGFPIAYDPVRYPFFGVQSTVSGVGYNLAAALTTLGDRVRFLSLIGQDLAGQMAAASLRNAGLPAEDVLVHLPHTAQSVILYEAGGRRQIHVDLKDIQERAYPPERFAAALPACELAVLCNINFSRPFLQAARRASKLVATDVHALASLEDDYNQDFMAAADILFLSDERLPIPPEEFGREVLGRFGAQIVVIGLGAHGCLLFRRGENGSLHIPAVTTRPVVSTIGAGDALFAAFLHFYLKLKDPVQALRRAAVFASYKIGAAGAAEGFLDEPALEDLYRQAAGH